MRILKRLHKKLSRIFFFIGAILLCPQLYGAFSGPVPHESFYADIHDKVAGYHTRLISHEEAERRFNAIERGSLSDEKKIEVILNLVYESFFHAPFNYDMRFYDNWIFWLFDQSVRVENKSAYLPIMDAKFLWRKGGGFCGQATQIFTYLANKMNFETRHLWNPQHFISEVYLPSKGWITVDADYGVYWNYSFEELANQKPADVISDKFIERGWTEDYAQSIAAIYQQPEIPWEIVTKDRSSLLSFQQQSLLLSYLIPVVFIVYGWIFGFRNS